MKTYEKISIELLILRALAMKKDRVYRQSVEIEGTIEMAGRWYFTPVPNAVFQEVRNRGIDYFPERIMLYTQQRDDEKVLQKKGGDGIKYSLFGEFVLSETTIKSTILHLFEKRKPGLVMVKQSYFLRLGLDPFEDRRGQLSSYPNNQRGALSLSDQEGRLSFTDEKQK